MLNLVCFDQTSNSVIVLIAAALAIITTAFLKTVENVIQYAKCVDYA